MIITINITIIDQLFGVRHYVTLPLIITKCYKAGFLLPLLDKKKED